MKSFGWLVSFCALVALPGCSKHAANAPAPMSDSTRIADSSRVADSLHVADSTRVADSTAAAIPTLTYEQYQGKHLYKKYCLVCHGVEGKGDWFNAFNLDPKPRDFSDAAYMKALDNDRLIQTIRDGGRGMNKSPLMPSWGGRLTKNEMTYLAAYVRTFAPAK